MILMMCMMKDVKYVVVVAVSDDDDNDFALFPFLSFFGFFLNFRFIVAVVGCCTVNFIVYIMRLLLLEHMTLY